MTHGWIAILDVAVDSIAKRNDLIANTKLNEVLLIPNKTKLMFFFFF